ncbi:MAG: DUF3108 domain-containing protein [Saprospiraceae bacterium]|nr:DUF3108 domain-containing protein [Saprospiraceae bacterium]
MMLNMGGQEMSFDVERTVKVEGDKVTVTDKTATPMGTSETIVALAKATLKTLSTESSGFMTSRLTFTDEKITGETSDFRGNKKPIDLDVTGEVYGNPDFMLPFLDLKEGYAATIKTYNPQVGKIVDMTIKVEGIEKVKVGAGEFDAFKVMMAYPDMAEVKIATWVKMEAPRYAVKSDVAMPQGGKMVTELSKVQMSEKSNGGEVASEMKGKKEKNYLLIHHLGV